MNADDFAASAVGAEWLRRAYSGEFGFTVGMNTGNGWLLPPYVATGGGDFCPRPTWVVTVLSPGGGGMVDVPPQVVAAAAKECLRRFGVR
jgi:hypothetical protein